MTDATTDQSRRAELLELTQRLLSCIREGDWQTYTTLCAEDLTCFEPEALGHRVEGWPFHRFYFDLGGHLGAHQTTLVDPRVDLLGEDAALVTYIRLVQSCAEGASPTTSAYEETRVWHRRQGQWKHVHFHRSRASS